LAIAKKIAQLIWNVQRNFKFEAPASSFHASVGAGFKDLGGLRQDGAFIGIGLPALGFAFF
jgi:hypothetical protein